MDSFNGVAVVPKYIASAIVDPSAYANGTIHEVYRWLRTHCPLGYVEAEGYDRFRMVTRHDDVSYISRNNDLFLSGERAAVLTNSASDRRTREITGGSPHLKRSIIQMDGGEHRKYRALTQAWFMPANVRRLESDVRLIAEQSIANLLTRPGKADFVEDLALGYPLRVIMQILGVPPEDEPRMLRLTQELFGTMDPDTQREIDAMGAAQVAEMTRMIVGDFETYFDAIIETRRVKPRDDLASVIANATIDHLPLPVSESTGYFVIVATAGHDTTSSSIAAAVCALAQHPDQFRRVRDDPSLIPALIDEALRWSSPVKTFMRTAAKDCEVNGQPIFAGDWLMLCYGSANRDELVFDEPFSFKSDRKPNPHLSFGTGAHSCLGQHLAKLEMRILFEQLLPRLETLELEGDGQLSQSYFVNGHKTLPIKFAVRE
jgi:cytochrome P450